MNNEAKETKPTTDEAAPVKPLVMSDLATLTQALDLIGLEHTVRQSGEYHYLFFGECRNIYHPDLDFSTGDLDHLLRCSKFIEFENGKLARQANRREQGKNRVAPRGAVQPFGRDCR